MLAVAIALIISACHTLPDVKPFAESTAALHHTVSATGHTAVSQFCLIEGAGPPPSIGAAPTSRIAGGFYADWQKREAMFQALDTYAAALVALVESGEQGAESAKSLAKSVNTLASTVTPYFPGTDPAVKLVTSMASQVFDIISKEIAAQQLGKAIELVDPVVHKIADLIAIDLQELKRLNAVAYNQASSKIAVDSADLPRLNSINQLRANLDPSDAAQLAKLKGYGEAIALETSSPWYLDYTRKQDGVLSQFEATNAILDQAVLSLKAWATAHHNIGVAVSAKHVPSFNELQQATTDLLTAYQEFRQAKKGK